MAGTLDAPMSVLAAGAQAPGAVRGPDTARSFAPLREELVIERGPSLRGGAPSWTLYDPVTNRFYRIGWLEFEILCRWHLGSAEEIAKRIASETTLRPTASEMEEFARFLMGAELLRSSDAQGTRRLRDRKASARTN